jgi:ABC-2 type transport system ATP-binding protein
MTKSNGHEGPLLRLEELGKDYGATVALQGLSCEVRPGELVGLLGPNGAGKTTTMKLLLGLLRPSRGRALVENLDCTTDARRAKALLGYCADEPAFYDFLTGRETVEFVTNVRGLSRDAVWDRLAPVVLGLEFASLLDRAVGGYSHGSKKKLALLTAFAHEPSVLLLDEPTNGLDPSSAAFAKGHLCFLAKAGAAVIVSTHLLEMADGLCDRILVLHQGRLFADGNPEEVRARAGLPPQSTLEDAFLRLVR